MKPDGRKIFGTTGLVVAGLILGLAVPAAAGEAKHLISGSSIKPHTITATQIKNKTITGAQIKNNAITGAQIKNNAITGKQVKESTLGAVPNAANTTNLGGKPASAYQGTVTGTCNGRFAISDIGPDGSVTCSPQFQEVLTSDCPGAAISNIEPYGAVTCTQGTIIPFYYILSATTDPKYKDGIAIGNSGIQMGLGCHDPGTQYDFEDGTGNNATVNWAYSTGGASSTVNASGAVIDANNANAAIFHFEGARLEGQAIFAVPSSTAGYESVVTINMHGYDGTSYCEYTGTAEIGTVATS